MFIINIILLILGMVMEPGDPDLMLPVLLPIAQHHGLQSGVLRRCGGAEPDDRSGHSSSACVCLFFGREQIKLERIYKAILPFLVPLLITLAVTCTFPQVVTFLPDMLLGATAA